MKKYIRVRLNARRMLDNSALPVHSTLEEAKNAASEHFINTFNHSGVTYLDTETFFAAEEQLIEFESQDDTAVVYCCIVKKMCLAQMPPVYWIPSFFN